MATRTTQVEVIVFKVVDEKILFLLLKRNVEKGGFWQPITGGVESGEDLVQAVKRELQEETGVTEYVRRIDDVYYFEFNIEEGRSLKEYVFGIEINPDIDIKISLEHTEMRWCSLDESLVLLKYDNNKIAFQKLAALLHLQGVA